MAYIHWLLYNNVVVNVIFYSSLISGLGEIGRVAELGKNLKTWLTRDILGIFFCYNALVDALAKSGKMEEGLVLFQRMEDEDFNQTVCT